MTPTPSGPDAPRSLSELLDMLGVRTNGDSWRAPCPAHDDRTPSLAISLGDRGAPFVIHCHAGCSPASIAEALGLSERMLLYGLKIDTAPSAPLRAPGGPALPGPGELAKMAARIERWAAAFPGSQAERYVLDRFGIGAEDAARLRLGYRMRRGSPQLIAPYPDLLGNALGYQSRDLAGAPDGGWRSAPSPREGGSWPRAGAYRAGADAPAVIVTEGAGDGLTAVAAGFDAVPVRGARMLDREPGRVELAALAGRLAMGRRPVLVAGDNDDAGRDFNTHALGALAGAVVLPIPEPHNDLTEWRQSCPDTFPDMLRRAVAEAALDARVGAAAKRLQAIAESRPDASRSDLYRGTTPALRHLFPQALEAAVNRGLLIPRQIAGRGRPGTVYSPPRPKRG